MRQRLGRWALRLIGWRIAGQLPSHGTYVVIGAPHTSNWDLPLGLLAAAAFGVKGCLLARIPRVSHRATHIILFRGT